MTRYWECRRCGTLNHGDRELLKRVEPETCDTCGNGEFEAVGRDESVSMDDVLNVDNFVMTLLGLIVINILGGMAWAFVVHGGGQVSLPVAGDRAAVNLLIPFLFVVFVGGLGTGWIVSNREPHSFWVGLGVMVGAILFGTTVLYFGATTETWDLVAIGVVWTLGPLFALSMLLNGRAEFRRRTIADARRTD